MLVLLLPLWPREDLEIVVLGGGMKGACVNTSCAGGATAPAYIIDTCRNPTTMLRSLVLLTAACSVSAQGISGSVFGFLQKVTPPPFVQSEDWNGTEYRYQRIVFRPARKSSFDCLHVRLTQALPSEFQVEGIFLLGIVAYFVLWYFGKAQNHRRATAWYVVSPCIFAHHPYFHRLDAHVPLFEAQFSAPIAKSRAIVQDGACDFFNYSTGRRGLVSLHTTLALLPRHDVLLRVYNFLWTMYDLTYTPRDEIQLDFTLQSSNPTSPFVWGILKKDEMAEMRRTRWDLVRITDSNIAPNPD